MILPGSSEGGLNSSGEDPEKDPEWFICIVQGSHATLSSAAQKLMEMIQEDKVLESTSDKGIKKNDIRFTYENYK